MLIYKTKTKETTVKQKKTNKQKNKNIRRNEII